MSYRSGGGPSGDGLRKSKDDTRTGVFTHHDFSWSPYGLINDSNASTIYTPGFGQRANGTDSFYQVDWLGSTRYTTNSSGNRVAAQSYDAFGKLDGQGPGSPNHPPICNGRGAGATSASGATERLSRGWGWIT